MPTNIEELFRMKKAVDDAAAEKIRAEAVLKERLAGLAALGHASEEDAKKALAKMEKELAALDKEIRTEVAELRETYGL